MWKFYYTFTLTSLFIFAGAEIFTQAVQDPLILHVYITENAITLNGMLAEASWSIGKLYMLFNKDDAPSGNSNIPTTGFQEVWMYNLKVDASSLRSGSYIYKFETENSSVHLLNIKYL